MNETIDKIKRSILRLPRENEGCGEMFLYGRRSMKELILRILDSHESRTEWMPIETAAQDGWPKLLFARAIHATAPVITVGFYSPEDGWIESTFAPNKPTKLVPYFWQELPSFPAQEAGEL